MNKNPEGSIFHNQCVHIGKKGSTFPAWFSCNHRVNLRQGQTFTTGLILLSLFLLIIFF